jgi:CHAD domain-containing protein
MPASPSPVAWTAAARALRETWPGVVIGEAAAVHRARVATRRLREALAVLGVKRRSVRRLRKDLQALTRVLGPVRELDVTLGLIVRLLHDEPDLEGALETMRIQLMHKRARRRSRLLHYIDDVDIAGLLARIRAIDAEAKASLAARQVPVDRDAVRRRIADRTARLEEAIGRAGALYAPEPLHEVRIALKKLRYALELGRLVRLPHAAREANSLRRFQDLLGEWHDWQVLSAHAVRVQGAVAIDDDRLAEFTTLSARVEDRCRALHAEFMTARDGLVARLTDIAAIAAATRHA